MVYIWNRINGGREYLLLEMNNQLKMFNFQSLDQLQKFMQIFINFHLLQIEYIWNNWINLINGILFFFNDKKGYIYFDGF